MAEKFRTPGNPPERRGDATLCFRIIDERINKFTFSSPPGGMDPVKSYLSGFRIVETKDCAGLNYDVFVQHTRGTWPLVLGGNRFETLFTETTPFLLASAPVDQVQSIAYIKKVMDVGKSYVLENGEGRRLYLYRLTCDEMERLRRIAADEQKAAGHAVLDPLRPQHDEDAVDTREFKKALKNCVVLKPDKNFDLSSFVDELEMVAPYRKSDHVHFVLADSKNTIYTLYVNAEIPKDSTVDRQTKTLCTLAYRGGVLKLYRTDIIT